MHAEKWAHDGTAQTSKVSGLRCLFDLHTIMYKSNRKMWYNISSSICKQTIQYCEVEGEWNYCQLKTNYHQIMTN